MRSQFRSQTTKAVHSLPPDRQSHCTVDYTSISMQQQSKHFSLWKKIREAFSAKNMRSNPENRRTSTLSSLVNFDRPYSADGIDPVSSGSIGGSRDVVMKGVL